MSLVRSSRQFSLGIERRAEIASLSEAWPAHRRRSYLLREGVSCPLSVDKNVWPLENKGRGVSVLLTACGTDEEYLARWMGLPVLESFSNAGDWQLLGYNVCDQTLISGLMNCGYMSDSEKVPFSLWVERLNVWHLFDDPADAAAFAEQTDHRVREHSPFHVFGLYRRRKEEE